MTKRLFSLKRDSAGTATIELGLIAPILATLLIGLVDLGDAYSDKLRLEQVAQRSIEKVQQSGFQPSLETALESEAAAAAGDGATADLTYWLECNGTRSSNYAAGCADGETYARYVQLDVQRNFTPMIPAQFAGGNEDGTFTIHGIAGIRFQ